MARNPRDQLVASFVAHKRQQLESDPNARPAPRRRRAKDPFAKIRGYQSPASAAARLDKLQQQALKRAMGRFDKTRDRALKRAGGP